MSSVQTSTCPASRQRTVPSLSIAAGRSPAASACSPPPHSTGERPRKSLAGTARTIGSTETIGVICKTGKVSLERVR